MEPLVKGLIAVFVLVVLVLCTVLAVVWSMPDLRKDFPDGWICLSGEQGNVHCGNTDQLLHNFLATAIEQQYIKAKHEVIEQQRQYVTKNRIRLMEIYDKYYWEMKPAAKLTGKEQSETADQEAEKMKTIKVWEHGKDLYYSNGFERYGARHRNGRIVVPVSGTYLVYSHVDLFEECDRKTGMPDISKNGILIQHAIYKFNILDENEIPVVSSVQPHTKSSNNYFNSYSSYISALAELKAGDELSVKVSSLSYLKYTNNNFFGVNLI